MPSPGAVLSLLLFFSGIGFSDGCHERRQFHRCTAREPSTLFWKFSEAATSERKPSPLVERFRQLGYPGWDVPVDLTMFNPSLLHERSVTQYVDGKKFTSLNGSTLNSTHLGKLTDSGRHVMIRPFHNVTMEALVLESQITAYLEDTGFVPHVHGLLPTGFRVANLALVIDVIDGAQTLESLMTSRRALSPRQYMSIAWHLSSAMLAFHKRYVLLNDIHESKVLVQWQRADPVVLLVDFGLASFREGRALHSLTRVKTTLEVIAPEVRRGNSLTSPESEIFSLGHVLTLINDKVNDPELAELGRACTRQEPNRRPPLTNVVARLHALRQRHSQREASRGEEPWEEGEGGRGGDDFNMTSLPLLHPFALSPLLGGDLALGTEELEDEAWVEKGEDWNIHVATLHSTGEDVWVTNWEYGEFEHVRSEAVVTRFLGDTGHVLRVMGVVLRGFDQAAMSLVTEAFQPSLSLPALMDGAPIPSDSPRLRVALAFKLASALAAFHARRVLINNFRSDNIRVRVAGDRVEVRFLRLALATRGRGFRHDLDRGDPVRYRHLAPEVRLRNALTTSASDVYSLGIILADLLTSARHPKVKATVDACLVRIPQERPSASDVALTFRELLSTFEHLPSN